MSRYVLVRSLLTFAVVVLATASFALAWSPMPVAWGLLVVSTVMAAAMVIGLRRLGLVGFVAALVTLAVPVLVMVLLGRSMSKSVVEALTTPFPELLTTPPPAPTTPSLLLPGLVIAWLVGASIGLAAAGRASRSVGVLGGLLGGLVMYLAAQLFTAGQADKHGFIAAGMVLLWLVDWSLWNRTSRTGVEGGDGRRGGDRESDAVASASRPGQGAGALVRTIAVAAVFAIVAALGAFVPLGEPFKPQDLVQRTDNLNSEPNPMPMLAGWAQNPDEEIFRNSGDMTSFHLAVMSDFDGTTFRPPLRPYDPVTERQTPVPPIAGEQRIVHTRITWPAQTRWLPAPGHPRLVSLTDAQLNVDSGTLIVPEVPAAGVLTYDVSAIVTRPDPQALVTAGVPDLPQYTALPPLPQPLQDYGDTLTENAESPLDKARALEEGIKANRQFTSKLPGGHSYGRLSTFLLAPESDGGRAGTSEQFASAFAVLARSQGLPTRVVVGFGPGTPDAEGSATNIVRGRDALAWPEIYFEGQGWVPFNPTPQTEDISPIGTQELPETTPERQGNSDQEDTPDEPVPPQTEQNRDLLLALLIPLAVLVLVVGSLLLARGLRRRRQLTGGAIGAWEFITDAVALGGHRMSAHASAPERAAALGADAAPAARRVALAAEREAFAPADARPQPTGPRAAGSGAMGAGVMGAGVADDAQAVENALRAETSWWRRMCWALNPLPLWRRR